MRSEDHGTDRFLKVSLVVAAISVSAYIFQLRGSLPGPAWVTVFGLILYPIARFPKRRLIGGYDLLYLAIFGAGIGGVLSYGSPLPVGYRDVILHYSIIRSGISGGHLTAIPESVSFNFIGLYAFTELLAIFFGGPIVRVVQFLPVVTYSATIITFYAAMGRHIVTRQLGLFATIIFALTWGVFRFGVEFRTLNIALLMIVVLLGVHLRTGLTRKVSKQHLCLALICLITLLTSHFTSAFFYLIIGSCFLALSLLRGRWDISVTLVFLGGIGLFAYMQFIGHGFASFVSFHVFKLLVSQPAGVGAVGVSSGVAGSTYGPIIMTLDWGIRFGFLIAGATIGLHWLRDPREEWTNILIPTSILGVCTVLAGVGLFFDLNPGRVLTYFAVFFSLIYVQGFTTLRQDFGRITPQQVTRRLPSNLTQAALAVFLCLLLLTSVSKLPPSVVGDMELIRGADVDHSAFHEIQRQDLEADHFIKSHLRENQQLVYNGSVSAKAAVIGGRGMGADTTKTSNVTIAESPCIRDGTVYVNGRIAICPGD